jgi:mannose-6-phosphate isomerase-like protein (cupin superfamily)
MQRHYDRTEEWMIAEGRCIVEQPTLPSNQPIQLTLTKHQTHHVSVEQWHRLFNPFDAPCKIVEIQYGIACLEEDIERR